MILYSETELNENGEKKTLDLQKMVAVPALLLYPHECKVSRGCISLWMNKELQPLLLFGKIRANCGSAIKSHLEHMLSVRNAEWISAKVMDRCQPAAQDVASTKVWSALHQNTKSCSWLLQLLMC